MTIALAVITSIAPQRGLTCASCRRYAAYNVTRWDGTGLTTACETHKGLWFRRLSATD